MLYLRVGGVPHIFEKIFMMAITLLWTSLQLKVCTKVMNPQSCKSPHLGNFRTLNLGVSGQNGIWVHAPWPSTENTWGKVVAFPKFKLW